MSGEVASAAGRVTIALQVEGQAEFPSVHGIRGFFPSSDLPVNVVVEAEVWHYLELFCQPFFTSAVF